jgi:hypothetical protein
MADFIDRLERACARAEYEFPRLAAPDGTVAVPFTDLRQLLSLLASANTHPKDGDVKQAPAPLSGAVAATGGETPTPSQSGE